MVITSNIILKINILRAKYRFLVLLIRKMCFRCLGMKIGRNVVLGQINCEWPNKTSIGNYTSIQDGVTFWIREPFNNNNKIIIGENVFIGRNTEFNCNNQIIIKNNCLIASNSVFIDATHGISKIDLISNQSIISTPIIVEEDVWIGTGCKILMGVIIGRGSVIGAGSVVNKSIPPYEVWAGVPARFINLRK